MTTRNMTDAQKLAEAEHNENMEARLGTEDDGDLGNGGTQPLDQNPGGDPLGGGVESRKPIQSSPADSIRSQIAARFRRPEAEERPFNGDLTDNENLYGQFGAEPSDDEIDEAAAAAEAAGDGETASAAPAQQQPTKRKLVVRGKEVELTDEEVLAAAQKTLAGDSYLDEARSLLEAAKEIRADRTGASRQHPDGGMGAQDELDPAADGDAQHPGQLPVELVQKLQFGDPEEAARELAEYIDKRAQSNAAKAVETSGVQRAFDQDLKRSQTALQAFQDANPDLANDEIAAMAIEANMYKLYREDMLALGLTEEQLPKTNKELANYHRFYRINGYEVRSTKDLLEASKGKFLEWRGGTKPAPQSEQRQGKPAPRIAVSVERDARRQAIPLQPSRASAPRRDVTTPAPSDRSAVVANMRKARGQV
jgi:hypothetical protein